MRLSDGVIGSLATVSRHCYVFPEICRPPMPLVYEVIQPVRVFFIVAFST